MRGRAQDTGRMALTVNRGVALLLGRENSAKPRVPHRAMVVAEFRTVVLRKLSGAVTYGFGRRDRPFGRDALRMSDMVLCAFLRSVAVVQTCAIRTRRLHERSRSMQSNYHYPEGAKPERFSRRTASSELLLRMPGTASAATATTTARAANHSPNRTHKVGVSTLNWREPYRTVSSSCPVSAPIRPAPVMKVDFPVIAARAVSSPAPAALTRTRPIS